MLDLDRVAALFSLFSDLEGETVEAWRPICRQAAENLFRKLRKDVEPEREMERLCTAAAAWAYCDYLMVGSSSAYGDEVKVGTIALKQTGKQPANAEALAIRTYFLEGISDLITPDMPVLTAVEEPL